MRVNIIQQVFDHVVMQTHGLTDTQSFIIHGDGFGAIAQPGVLFQDDGIDPEHAEQVAHSQPGRACAGNDDGEVGE